MATAENIVTQLYIGYFNRAPDPEGLGYWISRLDAGASIAAISDSFSLSPEAKELYPFLSSSSSTSTADVETFLRDFYQNIFGREIDPDGLAYYTAQVRDGHTAPSQIVTQILDNALTNAGSPDQAYLSNKVQVGLIYIDAAHRLGDRFSYDDVAKDFAHSILSDVNADASSVIAAQEKADKFVADFFETVIHTSQRGVLDTFDLTAANDKVVVPGPGDAVAQVEKISLSGNYKAGDAIKISGIASEDIVYTVLSEDIAANAPSETLNKIASKIAAEISKSEHGSTVTATAASNGEVTLKSKIPGNAFNLDVDVLSANGGQADTHTTQENADPENTQFSDYVIYDYIQFRGPFSAGDVITVIGVAPIEVSYTVQLEDIVAGDAEKTGFSIVKKIYHEINHTEGRTISAAYKYDSLRLYNNDKGTKIEPETVQFKVNGLFSLTSTYYKPTPEHNLTVWGTYDAGDQIAITGLTPAPIVYTVTAEDVATDEGLPSSWSRITEKLSALIKNADIPNADVSVNSFAWGSQVIINAKSPNPGEPLPSGITAVATNSHVVAQIDELTLSGSFKAGDDIKISGLADADIVVTVDASDLGADSTETLVNLAKKVADEIGKSSYAATVTADASSNDGIVKLTSKTPGQGFTIDVDITTAGGGDVDHAITSNNVLPKTGSSPSFVDIVNNFSLANDKLALPGTKILGEDGSDSFITDGVFNFSGESANLNATQKYNLLLTKAGKQVGAIAFVHEADSYVLYTDGIAGAQESDVIIKLAGVQVQSLGDILTTA